MRPLTFIAAIVFLRGISTVAAAPYPPTGWAGEVLWVVLACSAVVTVLALEADLS
jgi:hypothetical protein